MSLHPPHDVDALLARLWEDYTADNPQVRAINELLRERGETVVNDHVALRTFADPRIGIDVLAAPFVAAGYAPRDSYRFAAKKLRARHYEHADPLRPKIFISELDLRAISARGQAVVDRLIAQIPEGAPDRWDFCTSGRVWEVSRADYDILAADGEYPAWVAAFGFRANHFTVSVNHLETVDGLAALNEIIESAGFALNRSGGAIKGSPEVLLEQSSTVADEVSVELTDGSLRLPCCYYEFALRHRGPDGALFQGFVTASADRIFESTDRRA